MLSVKWEISQRFTRFFRFFRPGGHGFVAYAYLVAVPTAAGIGEVEDGRTSMHADGGDGNEFPEFLQVTAK